MPALSPSEIESRTAGMAGWRVEAGELTRTFAFAGFPAAIAFVNQVAEVAEAAGHHPDMDIRYSRVRIGLTTHDQGGITEKDFSLAEAISRIARQA